MTDYTKTVDFTSKDSLASGNPSKIVLGAEIDTEFNNIASSVATKANSNSPTLVSPALGTPTSGNLTNCTGGPTLTSATLITPALGTPASGVLTNCTGTATALNIGGNAATATLADNLSGTPTLPNGTLATTQAITDSSTKLATTAFVKGLFTPITNSLTGDVALSVSANYYTGPTIAQGTVGTWFVSGQVTVAGNTNDVIYGKLWDGTTLIASGIVILAQQFGQLAFSGYITSPAGNLRIDCRDISSTAGTIRYNFVGAKDSTITAIRIG